MAYKLVRNLDQIVSNMIRYENELKTSPRLQGRITLTHSWYAFIIDGKWRFGPSKFIGYANITAADYLATSNGRDGKITEPHLQAWFEPLSPRSKHFLGLAENLTKMVERYDRRLRSDFRINVPKEFLVEHSETARDTLPDVLVDVMIAAAKCLPNAQMSRLRAELRAR